MPSGYEVVLGEGEHDTDVNNRVYLKGEIP